VSSTMTTSVKVPPTSIPILLTLLISTISGFHDAASIGYDRTLAA
jgi:hypothetical protein